MNESPLRNPATDDDEQPTETWVSIGDVAKMIVDVVKPKAPEPEREPEDPETQWVWMGKRYSGRSVPWETGSRSAASASPDTL